MSGFPDWQLVWHQFRGMTSGDVPIWMSAPGHWMDAPFVITPVTYPDGSVSRHFAARDNANHRVITNVAETPEEAKHIVAQYIAEIRDGHVWDGVDVSPDELRKRVARNERAKD